MKKMTPLLAMCLTAVMSHEAYAGKLKHEFEVPAFGGNPLNAGYFTGIASSINDYDDPDRVEYVAPTEVERLLDSLKAQLISQMLYDVRQGETGSLETDAFRIDAVSDGAGGVVVKVFDTTTGETTEINVGGLAEFE